MFTTTQVKDKNFFIFLCPVPYASAEAVGSLMIRITSKTGLFYRHPWLPGAGVIEIRRNGDDCLSYFLAEEGFRVSLKFA